MTPAYRILAGTDQVVPGFSIHRELELLVCGGMAPMQAIRTTTTIPRKCSVVPIWASKPLTKRADLVLLDANPLEKISNIRRVYLTVADGKAYWPKEAAASVDIR